MVVPSECEIDVDEFVALLRSKGPIGAEDVVFTALEDMAAKIERIRLHWLESELAAVPALARRLAQVAKCAGLVSLSTAASAFHGAVGSQNGVAISATLHRIDRSFDASVEAVWQVFDEI